MSGGKPVSHANARVTRAKEVQSIQQQVLQRTSNDNEANDLGGQKLAVAVEGASVLLQDANTGRQSESLQHT